MHLKENLWVPRFVNAKVMQKSMYIWIACLAKYLHLCSCVEHVSDLASHERKQVLNTWSSYRVCKMWDKQHACHVFFIICEFSLFGFACLLVMSFSKHVRFSWTNSQEVVSGKRGWVNSSLKWRESETNSYLSIRSYIYKSRSSSSHQCTSISIKHPRDSKIQWAMHLPLKFGPYQRYVMWFKISKEKCLFDQNTKAVNGLYVLTGFHID